MRTMVIFICMFFYASTASAVLTKDSFTMTINGNGQIEYHLLGEDMDNLTKLINDLRIELASKIVSNKICEYKLEVANDKKKEIESDSKNNFMLPWYVLVGAGILAGWTLGAMAQDHFDVIGKLKK